MFPSDMTHPSPLLAFYVFKRVHTWTYDDYLPSRFRRQAGECHFSLTWSDIGRSSSSTRLSLPSLATLLISVLGYGQEFFINSASYGRRAGESHLLLTWGDACRSSS